MRYLKKNGKFPNFTQQIITIPYQNFEMRLALFVIEQDLPLPLHTILKYSNIASNTILGGPIQEPIFFGKTNTHGMAPTQAIVYCVGTRKICYRKEKRGNRICGC